jgi:hypothetical protein
VLATVHGGGSRRWPGSLTAPVDGGVALRIMPPTQTPNAFPVAALISATMPDPPLGRQIMIYGCSTKRPI